MEADGAEEASDIPAPDDPVRQTEWGDASDIPAPDDPIWQTEWGDAFVSAYLKLTLESQVAKDLASGADGALRARLLADPDWKPDREERGRFVRGAARNLWRKLLRREATHERNEGEYTRHREDNRSILGNPLEELDARWLYGVLMNAIAKLNPHEQDIIHMRYFQGMEPQEIGAALGIKNTQIRVELDRAKKKMRKDKRLKRFLDERRQN
jgi:RNA polymerase sigma factor (sigma-70 family)